jgi:hypothetical protein
VNITGVDGKSRMESASQLRAIWFGINIEGSNFKTRFMGRRILIFVDVLEMETLDANIRKK